MIISIPETIIIEFLILMDCILTIIPKIKQINVAPEIMDKLSHGNKFHPKT
jgi:hypothetical protein